MGSRQTGRNLPRRQVSVGDERAFEDPWLSDREKRLLNLPLDAKTYDQMRDKKRARRRMKG